MNTHRIAPQDNTPVAHDVPTPVSASDAADQITPLMTAEMQRLRTERARTRFQIVFLTSLIVALAATALLLIVRLPL